RQRVDGGEARGVDENRAVETHATVDDAMAGAEQLAEVEVGAQRGERRVEDRVQIVADGRVDGDLAGRAARRQLQGQRPALEVELTARDLARRARLGLEETDLDR